MDKPQRFVRPLRRGMRSLLFILLPLLVGTLGFMLVADGALDTTFDTDGKLTTTIVSNCSANAVAIQSDGKIVAVGWVGGAGLNQGFGVARYDNSNGALDAGFDTDGKLITQFQSNSYAEATCVAIQSDGKIVVAGFAYVVGKYVFAVARYETNGALDATFSGDGKVSEELGLSDDRAYGVAIQSDGKIVVTGYSQNGTDYDLAVVRYTTSGALDSGFDGDGIVTTTIASEAVGQSIAIQSDGKIVIGGYLGTGSSKDFVVVRYSTTGGLDAGFDSDGYATTAIGAGEDHGSAVAIQADGMIVLAGYTYTSTRYQFALARYTTAGALDAGFDTDGKVTTSVSVSDSDFVYAMALQLDGKIVVAGYSETGWGTGTFALARYTTSGALDATFDSDGKLTTAFGGIRETARGVAIQSDGSIVAVGEQYNTGYWFALARYTGSSGPLPVEMTSFVAQAHGLDSHLKWSTATETNNYGFEIERRTIGTQAWSSIGFVVSPGTSSSPRDYSYVDHHLVSGRYAYRIKQIDNNGSVTYTGEVEVEVGLAPKELTLGQNYPNPFNPTTTIAFSVPADGHASLKVFDALGREVATLANGEVKAGYLQQVTFDASRVASGVYHMVLESGGKRMTKKMQLVR